MNFLNLQYFCTVAEELNFTKAARKLYVSQQSLSNHISRLESELGVVLFNRTQPVSLTEAGEYFYCSSKELLKQKVEIEKKLQDIKEFGNGELTIGVSTSRGAVMLAKILPEFCKEFPQIQLHLIEGTTNEINQALYEGKTDINIGFSLEDPDNVYDDELYEERFICAVPNRFIDECFDMSLQADTYDFRFFSKYPFIKMSKKTWLGEAFENHCKEHNVSPKVVLETSSMSTMVSLCVSGMGAILIPEIFTPQGGAWCCQEWSDSVSFFIIERKEGHSKISVSHLRNRYLSRAAQEFSRITKQIYKIQTCQDLP